MTRTCTRSGRWAFGLIIGRSEVDDVVAGADAVAVAAG